jgi:hypothetical protein
MQDQEKNFRIFGFMDLQKSLLSNSSVSKEGHIIEGRFLNTVRDISGEIPIVPEMIWDILKKSGNIKYEHDPVSVKKMEDGTMMAVAEANPKNIMGAVLDIKTSKDGKEAFFRATLFPENELTKSLIKTAQQFDEHNKRFPKNQRHFQLSVEGKYYKRDKITKSYAGIAENIVISPQAQDDSTYFQFVNTENLAMAKSLAAGHETNLPDMRGGDSLRQESLQGNHNKSSKEKKKMERLGKNRDEVFAHFKKSCKTPAEAMEKTNAHMKALEEERGEEGGKFAKSLNDGIDKIRKSIASFGEVVTLITSKQADVVSIDSAMKKSINTLRADQALPEDERKFSGEEFLAQQVQATVQLGQSQNEVNSQLVKSLSMLAEGLADTLPLLKSIHEATLDAVEQATDANETSRYIARGLKKSSTGLTRSVDAIEAIGSDGDKPTAEKILKSINMKAVDRFLTDRYVSNQNAPELAAQYHSAMESVRVQGRSAFSSMNKSIIGEVVKVFEAQFQDVPVQ